MELLATTTRQDASIGEPMEITQLYNSDDFFWYKKALDLKRKCEHIHENDPTHYPCRVYSNITEVNRDDFCYHHFLYQIPKTCVSCGHESLQWPEIVET